MLSLIPYNIILYNFKRFCIFLQGEYRIYFLGIMSCNLIQSKEKIQFHLYLSKTSANTNEIKGNLSNSIPIDDPLDVSLDIIIIMNSFSLNVSLVVIIIKLSANYIYPPQMGLSFL